MPYKDIQKARECRLKWYFANREKSREATRRWRRANPEKSREATRRWQRANPEKVCAGNKKQQWLRRQLILWAKESGLWELLKEKYDQQQGGKNGGRSIRKTDAKTRKRTKAGRKLSNAKGRTLG